MQIIIGGVELPKPSGFRRTVIGNESNNVTLGGVMYTDFINNRRSWRISWENLKYEDYEIIYDLYFRQYEEETYHYLQFDAYGLYVPVKIEMSEEEIKHNSVLIKNFSITLIEAVPFS